RVNRGTTGTGAPFTSTGSCQTMFPVFTSNACTIPTPFGYCVLMTTRPISASPLAVVVTGLEQDVALPRFGPAAGEFSSCFQAILFFAGLNATRRAIDSACGTNEYLSCMTPHRPPGRLLFVITGC